MIRLSEKVMTEIKFIIGTTILCPFVKEDAKVSEVREHCEHQLAAMIKLLEENL